MAGSPINPRQAEIDGHLQADERLEVEALEAAKEEREEEMVWMVADIVTDICPRH